MDAQGCVSAGCERAKRPPRRLAAPTRRRPRGFTLVELLVVIAILVLLISLLLSTMTRAKSLAVRFACANNLKFIGTTTFTFAASHGGRAPGGCSGPTGGVPGGQPRGRGWVGYLNVEVLGQTQYWASGLGPYINQHSPARSSNQVFCPSILDYANLYCIRGYLFNLNAAGGPEGWGGYPLGSGGPYGIPVNPPPSPQADDLVGSRWDYYTLGAVLARFPNPSQQFLVTEAQCGSDYCGSVWPAAAPYTVTLGDMSQSWEPRCAAYGGAFAFRHTLPVNVSQYQGQATANFLFIDGHVQALSPNDKINANDRFAYEP